MERMSGWDKFILAVIIIGAINWGLIGFFRFDLIATLFGGMYSVVSRTIYSIIGLAGLWSLSILFRRREEPATRPEHRLDL